MGVLIYARFACEYVAVLCIEEILDLVPLVLCLHSSAEELGLPSNLRELRYSERMGPLSEQQKMHVRAKNPVSTDAYVPPFWGIGFRWAIRIWYGYRRRRGDDTTT